MSSNPNTVGSRDYFQGIPFQIESRRPTSTDLSNGIVPSYWLYKDTTLGLSELYLLVAVVSSSPSSSTATWILLGSADNPLISLSDTSDTPVYASLSTATPPYNVQLTNTDGSITITADPSNNRMILGLAGGSQAIDSFIVSTGTNPVVPAANGSVTLTDGNGIGWTGGTNAVTANMVSPFTGAFTFTGNLTALGFLTSDTANALTITSNAISANGSNTDIDLVFTPKGTGVIDMSAAQVVVGSLNVNSAFTLPTTDGTANQIMVTDGAGNVTWVNNDGPAQLLQFVSSSFTGFVSTSAVMPTTSTPTDTDGALLMTINITPKSASSILYFNFSGSYQVDNTSGGTAGQFSLALFQNGITNTLMPFSVDYCMAGDIHGAYATWAYQQVSGTTDPLTFSIRYGCPDALGIFEWNYPQFGGEPETLLIIQEITS